MAELLAVGNARRRRAQGVDDSDVEGAFRSLIFPRHRPLWLQIVGDVSYVAACGIISYGVTLVSSSPVSTFPGSMMIGAGIIVGALGAVLKYAPS